LARARPPPPPQPLTLAGLDDDDLDALYALPDIPAAPFAAAPPPPPASLVALASSLQRPRPDAVSAVPPSRWDVDALPTPGGARFVAALPGAAAFDGAAFSVGAAEAAALDPQQRLVLEAAAAALAAATMREGEGGGGVVGRAPRGATARPPPPAGPRSDPSSVSVAVGISYVEYALDVGAAGAATPHTAGGGTLAAAPGRVSFSLNLKGPCIAVDTACSSSLVAAHMSGALFLRGAAAVSRAVAAGVNLTLRPATPAILVRAAMLAPDGRCKTLDGGADGYGRGEAVVALVLQGAGAGVARGASPPQPPLALLAGSAVAQDGRSASLSAPSGPAQQTVLRAAAAAARGGAAAPVLLSRLELHGTGTPLGDPIEISAAMAALDPAPGGLALGAAKAATAHGEPAAGAVGARAAAAVAAGGPAVALAHLRTLNPHVRAALRAGGRALLPRAACAGAGAPAHAGVSAFAYQGTNAHAIWLPGTPAADSLESLPWRRARAWFRPRPHALASRAAGASFATPLAAPALAWLADAGAALPAVALCEAAVAAGAALAAESPARPALLAALVGPPLRRAASAALTIVVAADGGVNVGVGALVGRLAPVGAAARARRAPRRCRALAAPAPPPAAPSIARLDARTTTRTAFATHPALAAAAASLALAGGARARAAARAPAAFAAYLPTPSPTHAAARASAGDRVEVACGDGRGGLRALAAGVAVRERRAVAAAAAVPAAEPAATPAPRPRPPALPQSTILAAVLAAAADVAGAPPPAPDAPLTDAGVDSLAAVALRDALQARFGVRLAATAVYDHPTPAALAARIGELLGGGEAVAAPVVAAAPAAGSALALVAIACRAPAPPTAPVHAQLDVAPPTALLAAGADASSPAPPSRWLADASRAAPRFASFLAAHAGAFDAAAFRISPADAAATDPQARLALECAAAALAASAPLVPASSLPGAGVFIGCVFHEYYAVLDAAGAPQTAAALTGTGLHFLAGRICYTLSLTGPCVALDTACSSSLVAAHAGGAALERGDAGVALAGGVSLMLLPETAARLAALAALSVEGRCRSLDAAANGYGRGEGCVLLGLAATADPAPSSPLLPPLALVAATVVNQAGRSSGLTAPSGPAQAALLGAALARAHAAPADVGSLALHGTGTPLGDPIEIGGVGAAYAGAGAGPLALLAPKAGWGHTEGAAGAHGAAAAAAGAAARTATLTLHLTTVNPHVADAWADWWAAGAPRPSVARSRAPAPTAAPLAAASSFGMSGVNAHALLRVAPNVGTVFGASRPMPWARATLAAAACAAHLASSFASTRFATPLASPPLAHLWDHIVGGRPILPGAGMMEAAAAAAAALAHAPARAGANAPTLAGVAIAAPVPLPLDRGTSLVLECSVGADGGVIVGAAGRGACLRARVSRVGAAVAAAPPPKRRRSTLAAAAAVKPSSRWIGAWRGRGGGAARLRAPCPNPPPSLQPPSPRPPGRPTPASKPPPPPSTPPCSWARRRGRTRCGSRATRARPPTRAALSLSPAPRPTSRRAHGPLSAACGPPACATSPRATGWSPTTASVAPRAARRSPACSASVRRRRRRPRSPPPPPACT